MSLFSVKCFNSRVEPTDRLTRPTHRPDATRQDQKKVFLRSDYETAESRGFAFVRFYDVRDAEDAMLALNGRKFDGRPLRIQFARYGRPGSPEDR